MQNSVFITTNYTILIYYHELHEFHELFIAQLISEIRVISGIIKICVISGYKYWILYFYSLMRVIRGRLFTFCYIPLAISLKLHNFAARKLVSNKPNIVWQNN